MTAEFSAYVPSPVSLSYPKAYTSSVSPPACTVISDSPLKYCRPVRRSCYFDTFPLSSAIRQGRIRRVPSARQQRRRRGLLADREGNRRAIARSGLGCRAMGVFHFGAEQPEASSRARFRGLYPGQRRPGGEVGRPMIRSPWRRRGRPAGPAGRRGGALAGGLAGGKQLAAGPLGERRHPHRVQHVAGDAQLLYGGPDMLGCHDVVGVPARRLATETLPGCFPTASGRCTLCPWWCDPAVSPTRTTLRRVCPTR